MAVLRPVPGKSPAKFKWLGLSSAPRKGKCVREAANMHACRCFFLVFCIGTVVLAVSVKCFLHANSSQALRTCIEKK